MTSTGSRDRHRGDDRRDHLTSFGIHASLLLAGKAAGLQDALFGFGMRYAHDARPHGWLSRADSAGDPFGYCEPLRVRPVGRACARSVTMLESVFAWVEGTRVAQTIAQSLVLTGVLSGTHLIGLTLVLGGALASSLRAFGFLFQDRPGADVTSAMVSGISVGLGLSVITGALLVAPRLSDAAANGTFRIKMLVLVAAATFHLTIYRRIGETQDPAPGHGPWSGAVGLSLWLAVALAGCAYILLE